MIKSAKDSHSIALIVLFFLSVSQSCQSDNTDRYGRDKLEQDKPGALNGPPTLSPTIERKIGKAVYYIENSASMFGYVRSSSEYVDVLSELSTLPKFVEEKTAQEFNFINGGEDLEITHLGDLPTNLNAKLNVQGYKCGDYTKSNLNSMFQIALERAREDSISILISDGIYDIGNPTAPLAALTTQGNQTRSRFIERLGEGEVQTILIKLYSGFEGDYYPSTGGSQYINQTRPFYIWVFGESALLNKYFPIEYIKSLNGFSDVARFLKFDEFEIPYEIATDEIKLGSFKTDREVKHKLIDVEMDRHGQGFKFSFATDFSSLPFSDSYYQNLDNYSCTGDYQLTSVSKVEKKIHTISEFTPTHLISVTSTNNPYTELKIELKNVVPDWIIKTDSDEESNITNNTTKTYGFQVLTDAISEAYSFNNEQKSIMNFKFEINK